MSLDLFLFTLFILENLFPTDSLGEYEGIQIWNYIIKFLTKYNNLLKGHIVDKVPNLPQNFNFGKSKQLDILCNENKYMLILQLKILEISGFIEELNLAQLKTQSNLQIFEFLIKNVQEICGKKYKRIS